MSTKVFDKYFSEYEPLLDSLPSIYYLWKQAQKFVEINDERNIKKVERLIFLLHNSVVSPKIRLGKDVKFAYGGIGTVLHTNCKISDYVAIGQGVTIGGTPGKSGITASGERFSVPIIEEHVCISAGSRILGGIKIGKFSVIGANTVVLQDIDEFSIVVGQPSRVIKKLTKKNCLNYRSFFHGLKDLSKDEYVRFFPE